jgi:O-antigen ligase
MFEKIVWDNRPLSIKHNTVKKNSVRSDSAPLPVFIWIIFAATTAALFGGPGIWGYRLSGLAWFVPLIFAILVIFMHSGKISFPYKLWIPWILLLTVYLVVSEYRSLQRTVQLICPVVIGIAASTYHINPAQAKRLIAVCRQFILVLMVVSLLVTGVLMTGKVPMVTGLAPHAMTALIMCNLFAVSYTIGNRKDVFWWFLSVGVPVFAVTRTAIFTAILTLPLTLASMKMKKRIIMLVVCITVGLVLLHTERIQQKMFKSGKGGIENLQAESIKDNGRKFIWQLMKLRISKKPWLGYGTGSGEAFTRRITDNLIGYPHNDWLLTLHDQGIVGTATFLLCMILTVVHALRMARQAENDNRILLLSGASSFVSMALVMVTDNIMVYTSYFGNLHFMLLGLAYAEGKNKKKADEPMS